MDLSDEASGGEQPNRKDTYGSESGSDDNRSDDQNENSGSEAPVVVPHGLPGFKLINSGAPKPKKTRTTFKTAEKQRVRKFLEEHPNPADSLVEAVRVARGKP